MVTWRRLAELIEEASTYPVWNWLNRETSMQVLIDLIVTEAEREEAKAQEASSRACDCHQEPHRLDCRSRK